MSDIGHFFLVALIFACVAFVSLWIVGVYQVVEWVVS